MCSICGCGDSHSENHHHTHPHEHSHPHTHSHEHNQHSHSHEAAHNEHTESHQHVSSLQPIIIHHHYYHQGDVHHHIHYHTGAAVPADAVYEDDHGDLDYGQGAAGAHASGVSQGQLIELEQDILSNNNHIAAHNREHFLAQSQLVLNLMSSPGSGKTSLLTETLNRMKEVVPCAVIEGDQQTSNDADRIRATGVDSIQVNTGKGCHLDAQMIHEAYHKLGFEQPGVLFIENVGNLVCPAGFDLGEAAKVVILSVTEGEDKPLKYPHMFAASQLMIINKIDLLDYVEFNVDTCIANAKRVNPDIQVIKVSATRGEGIEAWQSWLTQQQAALSA